MQPFLNIERSVIRVMKKCRFIFVRHGESEGNLHSMFLGHTDLDLTPLGHEQAECTARYLDSMQIDAIYSSDLKRAWQTAEHIAERKGLSIIADSAYREIYAGKWEGMIYDRISEIYPEAFGVWRSSLGNAVCTDGESVKEVLKRVMNETQRLAQLYEGMTVCVATHATPIRTMRAEALGLGIDGVCAKGPANASVTVIDMCGGKPEMICDGYSEHLSGLITLPKNV